MERVTGLVPLTLHRYAKPKDVRSLLLAYYRILDAAEAERAQRIAERASVEDLWAVSELVKYYRECIGVCRTWLTMVARRGGRGIPVAGCKS